MVVISGAEEDTDKEEPKPETEAEAKVKQVAKEIEESGK